MCPALPDTPPSALALHNSSTGAESDLINEFITETRGNHASKAEEEKKDSPWNKSLFYYITGWARRGEDDEDEQDETREENSQWGVGSTHRERGGEREGARGDGLGSFRKPRTRKTTEDKTRLTPVNPSFHSRA